MGVVFPEEPRPRSLPSLIIYELNIILDESKPLPIRAALLVKWYNFLREYKEAIQEHRGKQLTNQELEPPRIETLTPKILREYAQRLARIVSLVFYAPS